uniref:Uncharacterized protein n=1 Tax=Chlorocebus sabaeus TaxID=60711 RepID=A0A0D9QW24_CHLSB
ICKGLDMQQPYLITIMARATYYAGETRRQKKSTTANPFDTCGIRNKCYRNLRDTQGNQKTKWGRENHRLGFILEKIIQKLIPSLLITVC